MRGVWLLTLTVGVVGCRGVAKPPDAVLPLAVPVGKWVFVGDSLTAGDTVEPGQTFVALIGQRSM